MHEEGEWMASGGGRVAVHAVLARSDAAHHLSCSQASKTSGTGPQPGGWGPLLYKIYIVPTVCASLYNIWADSTITIQFETEGIRSP